MKLRVIIFLSGLIIITLIGCSSIQEIIDQVEIANVFSDFVPGLSNILTGMDDNFSEQAENSLAPVLSMEIDINHGSSNMNLLDNSFYFYINLDDISRENFKNLFTITDGEEVPVEHYSEWEKLQYLLNQEITDINIYHQDTNFHQNGKFDNDTISPIKNIIDVNKNAGSISTSMDMRINNIKYEGYMNSTLIKLNDEWKISGILIMLEKVAEIELMVDPVVLNLQDGESQKLKVTVKPTDAEISFISNDEQVVVVDEDGLIETTGIGETFIIVSAVKEGYSEAEIEVEVNVIENEGDTIFDPVTLSVNIEGEGTVEIAKEVKYAGQYPYLYIDWDNLEWTEFSEDVFERNTRICLRAVPASDWIFDCWNGINCGDTRIANTRKDFVLNTDMEYSATFFDVSGPSQAEFSEIRISHDPTISADYMVFAYLKDHELNLEEYEAKPLRKEVDYPLDFPWTEESENLGRLLWPQVEIGPNFIVEIDTARSTARHKSTITSTSKLFTATKNAFVTSNINVDVQAGYTGGYNSYFLLIDNPGRRPFEIQINWDMIREDDPETYLRSRASVGTIIMEDASGYQRTFRSEEGIDFEKSPGDEQYSSKDSSEIIEIPAGFKKGWLSIGSCRNGIRISSDISEPQTASISTTTQIKLK